ncbi:hypothetical protein CRE_14853 [Caenorhabditis remanei]|uniref:Uncharacterized protein n=1 Tax=Caenorhabditis remanei TaxID=31234 RepID=E3N1R5_CAERE|nr:hypothetical protein CRE_14853 [Caenorhabditis remanei]
MVLKLKDNQQSVQLSSEEDSKNRVKRYLNLNEVKLHEVAYLGRKDGRIYPKNHKFYYWDPTRRRMLNVVEESGGKKR